MFYIHSHLRTSFSAHGSQISNVILASYTAQKKCQQQFDSCSIATLVNNAAKRLDLTGHRVNQLSTHTMPPKSTDKEKLFRSTHSFGGVIPWQVGSPLGEAAHPRGNIQQRKACASWLGARGEKRDVSRCHSYPLGYIPMDMRFDPSLLCFTTTLPISPNKWPAL